MGLVLLALGCNSNDTPPGLTIANAGGGPDTGGIGSDGPSPGGGGAGGAARGDVGGSGGAGRSGTAGVAACDAPAHRPVAAACSQSFATAAPVCQLGEACTATGYPGSGTCVNDGAGGTACSFDKCSGDADCDANQVCSCQGMTRAYAGLSAGNSCIESNCRSDADCASGLCSPSVSFDAGPFYGVQGYFCRTPADTCHCDAECVPNGRCAFNPEVGLWACTFAHVAG